MIQFAMTVIMKGKKLKTIKSIQMRAKIEALKKIKKEMIQSIQEEIMMFTMSIEDEENKNGDLPDDVE